MRWPSTPAEIIPWGEPGNEIPWEGWDTRTRWYVELVPAGEFLVINYIEQTPAAG